MSRHRFHPDCPCRSCREHREAYEARPDVVRRRAALHLELDRDRASVEIRAEALRLFPVLGDPNAWSDPVQAEQARAGALWLREHLETDKGRQSSALEAER